MKIMFVVLFLIHSIIMTSCEDKCITIENREVEDIVDLISLTPLENDYELESVLTLKINRTLVLSCFHSFAYTI